MTQTTIAENQGKHARNFCARTLFALSAMLSVGAIAGCSQPQNNHQIQQQIGQKLMLDLRYYCTEKVAEKKCTTPMTKLPKELAEMIKNHNIGGIILFAENIQNIAQVTQLTHDLQLASNTPLFISIDQEGGRVARIPRNESTSFTGNMSIGATFQAKGTHYATLTGDVLAKELNSIGVNVNHAPTVDVNINPENPVINVRSYGEDANIVAKLGLAQLTAMQKQGVLTTLKHFPGHGDTNVDSHTGLPIVHHDLAKVNAVDLLPFQYAIDNGNPAMIMTAHIQYPNLDNSTFTAKDGTTMIKPATMSRQILTKLLREDMGFNGVIITDALDMAGISLFFNQSQAVIESFKAGVDIALMPMEIRYPSDINGLSKLIDTITNAVKTNELSAAEIAQSAQRIASLKHQYQLEKRQVTDVNASIENATKVLASAEHKGIEMQLAQDAITLVKNEQQRIPVQKSLRFWHLIMPDASKCSALTQALAKQSRQINVSCASLHSLDFEQQKTTIANSDLIISANITPKQSAVEMGGMEDLSTLSKSQRNKDQQDALLENLLSFSNSVNKPSIYISLRAPYDTERYGKYADAVLASYAYNIVANNNQAHGPAFDALAKVLVGTAAAPGNLPVTVNVPSRLVD